MSQHQLPTIVALREVLVAALLVGAPFGDPQTTSGGFLLHAASAAENYSYLSFYNGWFTLSLNEMSKFYENRVVINAGAIAKGGTAFSGSSYWTSSTQLWNDFDADTKETSPYTYNLASGNSPYVPASESHRVRAAKYF